MLTYVKLKLFSYFCFFGSEILNYLMSIIFILIIISLTLASGFLIAFFWAVKNGQFEDDYTPSVRILFDDETPDKEEELPEKNIPEKDQTKKNKGEKH